MFLRIRFFAISLSFLDFSTGFGFSQKINFYLIQLCWFCVKIAECPDTGVPCYPDLHIFWKTRFWKKYGYTARVRAVFFQKISDFFILKKEKITLQNLEPQFDFKLYTGFFHLSRGQFLNSLAKIICQKWKKVWNYRNFPATSDFVKLCNKKFFCRAKK